MNVATSSLAKRSGRARPQQNFRIAYAAFNDAALMVEVARYLRSINVEADLFLDTRSNSSEVAILKRNNIRFHFVENDHGFVEGVYGKIAEQIKEEWLFILTTDEIPTAATLEYLSAAIVDLPSKITCIGFPRCWVLNDENNKFAVSRANFIGPDYQWRIIRHRHVEFTPIVHTAGFVHNDKTRHIMPEGSKVFHLDWIVHSQILRRRKLDYYESIAPGCGEEYKKWYLPEHYINEHKLEPLTDPNVLTFAERVAKLRTDEGWVDSIKR